jgi:hypothetical protein
MARVGRRTHALVDFAEALRGFALHLLCVSSFSRGRGYLQRRAAHVGILEDYVVDGASNS